MMSQKFQNYRIQDISRFNTVFHAFSIIIIKRIVKLFFL